MVIVLVMVMVLLKVYLHHFDTVATVAATAVVVPGTSLLQPLHAVEVMVLLLLLLLLVKVVVLLQQISGGCKTKVASVRKPDRNAVGDRDVGLGRRS